MTIINLLLLSLGFMSMCWATILSRGSHVDSRTTATSISLTVTNGQPVSISFPNLITVTGGLSITLQNWNTIDSISFPKLKQLTDLVLNFAVGNCKDVEFPSLESASSISLIMGNNGEFAKNHTWHFGSATKYLIVSGALSLTSNGKTTGSIKFPGLQSAGSIALTARNEGNGIASQGMLEFGDPVNSRLISLGNVNINFYAGTTSNVAMYGRPACGTAARLDLFGLARGVLRLTLTQMNLPTISFNRQGTATYAIDGAAQTSVAASGKVTCDAVPTTPAPTTTGSSPSTTSAQTHSFSSPLPLTTTLIPTSTLRTGLYNFNNSIGLRAHQLIMSHQPVAVKASASISSPFISSRNGWLSFGPEVVFLTAGMSSKIDLEACDGSSAYIRRINETSLLLCGANGIEFVTNP
eukprot:TRINITY_DN11236_c0_g1_i1.p2 TRINITY_DN11236_c0_g1~~TRINITY_DN11236_c0_g1_i1.p2  ORF type:complete len:410 (+),score=42.79 TRINITY_DN11236_c0_g1_i1:116-1345(+)